MFERTMIAGWGDMDFNAHMGNTAYLDKAADLRMLYFAAHGFPVAEFRRRGLGPVVRTDEVTYFREVNLLDEIRVSLAVAGMADDGSRWILRNEFRRPDDQLAAAVMSAGGWLDLASRRLVTPPAGLLEVMRALSRTEDFKVLPSSIKQR